MIPAFLALRKIKAKSRKRSRLDPQTRRRDGHACDRDSWSRFCAYRNKTGNAANRRGWRTQGLFMNCSLSSTMFSTRLQSPEHGRRRTAGGADRRKKTSRVISDGAGVAYRQGCVIHLKPCCGNDSGMRRVHYRERGRVCQLERAGLATPIYSRTRDYRLQVGNEPL